MRYRKTIDPKEIEIHHLECLADQAELEFELVYREFEILTGRRPPDGRRQPPPNARIRC